MIVLHGNVKNRIITRSEGDAVKVTKNNTTLSNISIIDINPDPGAHNDGIQPQPVQGLHHNSQYALAMMTGLTITDSTIYSAGKLQGIFMGDGLLADFNISRNMIDTQSEHKITINGAIRGKIRSNTDGKYNLVKVILNPARVGGYANNRNIWINSFKGLNYEPIQAGFCEDNRKLQTRTGDIYLINFDRDLFRYAVEQLDYPETTMQWCNLLQETALQYGDRV